MALNGTFNLVGSISESANSRIDVDRINDIMIAAQGAGDIVSYSADPITGELVRLDSFTPPVSCISVAVYPGLGGSAGVVFLGASTRIYSYPYDSSGNFGVLIDVVALNDVRDLSIDFVNNKIYAAIQEAVWGATTFSFDSAGDNITQVSNLDPTKNNRACVFDAVNISAFYGGQVADEVRSYSSTTGAVIANVNGVTLNSFVWGVDVDGVNGVLLTTSNTGGLSSLSFNAGVSPSLTLVDNDHQGTTEHYGRVKLYAPDRYALVSTALGLMSYGYTTGAVLSPIQTEATYTGNGDVAINFTNTDKIVWMSHSSGIAWYTMFSYAPANWPQDGDVFLFQTIDNGDINLLNGVVEMNGGLETAAYLSLFGGNKEGEGPLEYWGNKLETDPVRKFHSETQILLGTIPATSSNLKRIEDAAMRDLTWFVSQGVATTLSVAVTIPTVNRVAIVISINVNGEDIEFKFLENWKGSL